MTNNEQRQAVAAELRVRIGEKVGDIWWAFMLRGLFALALGVSILIWPELTLGLFIRVIGFFVLLDGLAGLVSGMRSRELMAYLLPALISLAVGALLLFWPGVTLKLLMVFVGVWVLFMGAGLFLSGRKADKSDPDSSTFMTLGAVLAIVGLVLILWPGTGLTTITWLVAGLAFLVGIILIFLASKLRGINQLVKNARSAK
jgi:uncharacterized membrane protein HdeD (DUF308 family)